MYYRRKVALALLQQFGGILGKTIFQKQLLLLSKMQVQADYHFVPYSYGCFSFQAMADIATMSKYEQVAVDNLGIRKTDPEDYISQLKSSDRDALKRLYILHGKKSYRDLIRYTYTEFPYFAIHSKIATRYLSTGELERVNAHRPVGSKSILFTIGYESISLEQYLNKLIAEDVKVLVDVRNNPMSMKYGFSKNQLQNACNTVGIGYVHVPEVGIASAQRQTLLTQSDYDQLFAKYRAENLSRTRAAQDYIVSLLHTHQRIVLTCFEANICQCHRKHLAEALAMRQNGDYDVIHL